MVTYIAPPYPPLNQPLPPPLGPDAFGWFVGLLVLGGLAIIAILVIRYIFEGLSASRPSAPSEQAVLAELMEEIRLLRREVRKLREEIKE